MSDCDFLPLTDRAFHALKRTGGGDILDLVAVYPLMTAEQMAELTPNDAERVEEWALDDSGLAEDDLVEMGICSRFLAKIDGELWMEVA